MSGKWIFIASAALLGILLAIEFRLLTIGLCLLMLIRMAIMKNKHLFIIFSSVLILFIIIGMKSTDSKQTHYSAGNVDLITTFIDTPQIDGNYLKAIISTEKEKFLLTYYMKSENEKRAIQEKIKSGMQCMLSGEIVAPQHNRNEHGFNFATFLYRQNIHWVFTPGSIVLTNCDDSMYTFVSRLHHIRALGIERIERNFPSTMIPYAQALIFGERSLFSENAYQTYQKIGIVHLLAISGLHVGLIAGCLYFLLLRLGMTKETVYWILVVLLPLYSILSGANPPVIRAVIMTLLLFTANRWRLPITTLDAFSLSFIMFLLFDPFLIYNVGFQLSYCVSFCLIVSSKSLLTKHSSYVFTMLTISLISMLASLPILAFHFYEFSIVSILANLLFVPFYTVVVLPGMFLLFILHSVSLEMFALLSYFLSKLIAISEYVASLLAFPKFATLLTGKPGTYSLIFISIGVLIFFIIWEQKKNLLLASTPITLILLIHCALMTYSSKGEVVFIDVGQGDSILIKLPYNRGTYLIDTGGQLSFPIPDWQKRKNSFQVGKNILIPFLKSKGVHTIDKLILTHSDIDHIGAAEELIDVLTIKEVYISPNSWEKPVMKEVVLLAEEKNIAVREVKAGSGWKNQAGEFQFVYPIDDKYSGNNDSLVLFAKFGGLTWLFTGDLEKEGEEELMRYEPLKANVLKVGHHGSKTSTTKEFLAFLTPEYAVISAGKANRYGHPHPEVLEELENAPIHIFRTDEQGAIHYVFSKKRGTFKTILQ